MKTIALKKYLVLLALSVLLIFGITNAAIALVLKTTPWKINADGEWITQVRVMDRVDFVYLHASKGEEAKLPLWVYNGAAMRVILAKPETIVVNAKSVRPPYQYRQVVLPSPKILYPNQLVSTALPIGPYLVNIGWGWLGDTNSIKYYQLYRKSPGLVATQEQQAPMKKIEPAGWLGFWDKIKLYFSSAIHKITPTTHTQTRSQEEHLIATLPPETKTFGDNSVQPNTHYVYRLVMTLNDNSKKTVENIVTTPTKPNNKPLSTLGGKGIILFFNSDPGSSLYYRKLSPQKVIQETKTLGLHYIELRTVYGAFSHFNDPALVNWLNQFLDLAAANNIPVISWSIPRRETSASVATDAALAAHTTPAGNTFSAIALDLELGAGYMRNTSLAKQKISNYAAMLRKAMGKNYLLAAMVYSPWKSGYTNADYPYQDLAKYVDVLQPMEFWHYYYAADHHIYTQQEVTNAIDKSISLTQQLAGKKIPVNVIGQLTDLGGTGKPSAMEITVALQAAKAFGALGLSLFDWHNELFLKNGELSSQAAAIQRSPW
jgi:hypothetical protein